MTNRLVGACKWFSVVSMGVVLAGCPEEKKEEAPPPRPTTAAAPVAPKPPAPAAAPSSGDGGGDAGGDGAPKSKLAAATNDGLTLADRIAKRKKDEDKLATELAAQEKDRLIAYDKTKLAQHTSLLAFITKTRKALDDAGAKAKDEKGKAAFSKLVAGQRKGIDAQGKVVKSIDPKGGNSNIVTDEDISLNLLANEYQQALLDGDEAGLKEHGGELDKRIAKMEDWIKELKAAPKK